MKFLWSLISFAILTLFCGEAFAQSSPKLLPFQGRLTDQNGVAVSNGVRLVQFKIFEVPSGGSPVWAGELHRTTVNGGLVNVLLGSKTPFTAVDFDRQLFLETTVDINGDNTITAADPPMLPRQAILPVVFAKETADSRKLNGSDWTPIFGVNNPNIPIPASKLADASLPGFKIQPGTLTSNQISSQTINASLIASGTITSNQIGSGKIDVSNLAQQVAEALNPPGTIVAFGGTNIPSGWLLCDGRLLRSSIYPRLFAAIGPAWGTASDDGDPLTDFRAPDFRGLFLRGVDDSPLMGTANRDPDRGDAGRGQLHQGSAFGNRVGSWQNENFRNHSHDVWSCIFNGPATGTGANSDNPGNSDGLAAVWEPNPGSQPPQAYYGTTRDGERYISNSGGSETRPKNAYVNYIIKY